MARQWLNWNIPALLVQFCGIVLLLISLFLPMWLSNPSGLNYYPHPRDWGLIYVVGRTRKTNWETWSIACRGLSQMSIGFACTSPLCFWYSAKCSGYQIIVIISLVVFSLLCVVEVFAIGSFLCSLFNTLPLLRCASVLGFIAMAGNLAAMIVYLFGMNQAFSVVNSGGSYPVPQPGISFILACVALGLFGISGILHTVRFVTVKREQYYIEDMRDTYAETLLDLGVNQ